MVYVREYLSERNVVDAVVIECGKSECVCPRWIGFTDCELAETAHPERTRSAALCQRCAYGVGGSLDALGRVVGAAVKDELEANAFNQPNRLCVPGHEPSEYKHHRQPIEAYARV